MKARIVSFHCVLKDRMGKVLSTTFNHEIITQAPGQGNKLKALADGLEDMKKGEKKSICLSANEAYGFYNPSLVITVSRGKLSQGELLRNGHRVVSRAPEGETLIYRVIQSDPDTVTLDGNHPLAGQDLVFDIEATDAREATLQEIAESDFEEGDPAELNPYFH